MKDHTKLYLSKMGYDVTSFIPCEYCGKKADDIHHIDPRGMGGTSNPDVITNLMAICREHHHQADHGVGLSKEFLKEVHLEFMVTGIPYLQR